MATIFYERDANPNALKGKTIAVSQIGGQDDFIMRKVLKSKGITPDTDVHLIATKDIPGSMAALKNAQKAARQMYDAACMRLGIPNDLEEAESHG